MVRCRERSECMQNTENSGVIGFSNSAEKVAERGSVIRSFAKEVDGMNGAATMVRGLFIMEGESLEKFLWKKTQYGGEFPGATNSGVVFF